MDSQEHWNRFMQSGRIAEYLLYRDALRAELAREFHPAEDDDALHDRRHSDPGKGNGRA